MFDNATKQFQTSGSVNVIPTDTVYGLAARAADPAAVTRLYKLKHREYKPGTLIAASTDQLVELGIKRRYLTAVEQFWPGAVSVVIPCADPALEYLHQGKQSLAVRIPADPALAELLHATGPLLTSSANLPGEPTAVTIEQAKKTFADQVDSYVDGGDLSDRKASTIIQIIDDEVAILRQGSVEIHPEAR